MFKKNKKKIYTFLFIFLNLLIFGIVFLCCGLYLHWIGDKSLAYFIHSKNFHITITNYRHYISNFLQDGWVADIKGITIFLSIGFVSIILGCIGIIGLIFYMIYLKYSGVAKDIIKMEINTKKRKSFMHSIHHAKTNVNIKKKYKKW